MSVRIASLYAELGAKDSLTPALKGAKGELGTFKSSLGSAVSGLTGFSMAGLGAAAVVGGVTAAIRKSVTDIIDYNKSILDASRATRMGVEDLSRFVQVGDDMGVGMESITRALQLATKNGFAPSIDSLAKLADRANAMASPTERAAMLAKIMGRNWAELDPILQLGGDRIREIAAAQKDGLVVTEDEIEKTEELRLKIDELTDAWTAFRNEVGLKIVTEMSLEKRAMDALNASIEDQEPALFNAKGSTIGYALAWRDVIDTLAAVDQKIETVGDVAAAKGRFKDIGDAGQMEFGRVGNAAQRAAAAVEGLTTSEILRQVAEAIIAGDNKGAQALYEVYLQAKNADDRIKSIIAGMEALNGKSATAYINVQMAGGFGGAGGVGKGTLPGFTTPTFGTGMGPRVEGAGGKFYKMNYATGLYEPAAHGGPLSRGVTLVGEQGPELIVNGVVVPADETRKMLAMGLKPTDAFYRGSEENIAVGGNWLAPKPGWMASKDISLMPSYSKSVFSGAGVSSQDTPAQAAASAAVSAAAVSAAMAPQVAAAVGAAVPIAVGAMSAKQAEAIVASNDRLGDIFTRELRTLKHEMGRVVASAVQKVM